MDTQAERMRNALLWSLDRLTVDGGMTAKEQKDMADQIGRVLRGLPSRAATPRRTRRPNAAIHKSPEGNTDDRADHHNPTSCL